MMDTGKIRNNYTFYDGYEGEPEIILTVVDNIELNVHLWEGYFEDIFNEPVYQAELKGFTRDYHYLKGVFNNSINKEIIKTHEYLEDLKKYKNKKFSYEETRDVYDLLVSLLECAAKIQSKVQVELI